MFHALNLKDRPRTQIDCGIDVDPGRTRQSMRDECDINAIMRKYIKTGAIDHVNKYSGEYGFATPNSPDA